ncbi:hypothetical protein [Micromonospora sp. NPDC050276]|uniref:hypothetical protein n=1 Tax=Micromonospora sp. NPDC050276 TaxID=3364278 RepID=UPI00379EBEF9
MKTPSAGHHLADAYRDLVRGCATITQVVHAAHPQPGACLPLPAINLPQDADDVRRQIDMLTGNLFDEHAQAVNQQWLTATRTCTHLTADNVIAIKELYYGWYQLLVALNARFQGQPSLGDVEKRAADLAYTLVTYLRAYPTSPVRHLRLRLIGRRARP